MTSLSAPCTCGAGALRSPAMARRDHSAQRRRSVPPAGRARTAIPTCLTHPQV